VDIAAPPGADFGPALDKIFADGLADLVPSMPPYWQRFAQHLGNHSQTPEIDETTSAPHPVSPGARVTSTVHAPQALAMPEARFTQAARDAKLRGTVIVGLVVKEDGTVTRPYIVRPLGLGLDENAIDAVMQYRFKPAMRDDGTPVPVDLMVDVNFQIL
ncbi:MAG TPA: energy transducer TonB, partial [Acidobacteriaceae bacterium]|nr:energy transducer TonB [Acidobacteriaceae bacterium]